MGRNGMKWNRDGEKRYTGPTGGATRPTKFTAERGPRSTRVVHEGPVGPGEQARRQGDRLDRSMAAAGVQISETT